MKIQGKSKTIHKIILIVFGFALAFAWVSLNPLTIPSTWWHILGVIFEQP